MLVVRVKRLMSRHRQLPYQLNANAPINGVNPNYASITPTRNSPMRTITQSSIKTNGTDGVIQVMPVSENRIKEGREVIAGDKAPTETVRGDGTAPVDSKARHAARKDEMFLPATSIITGVLITGLKRLQAFLPNQNQCQ